MFSVQSVLVLFLYSSTNICFCAPQWSHEIPLDIIEREMLQTPTIPPPSMRTTMHTEYKDLQETEEKKVLSTKGYENSDDNIELHNIKAKDSEENKSMKMENLFLMDENKENQEFIVPPQIPFHFRNRNTRLFIFPKKQFETPTLTPRDEGRCNNLKLKMIMLENIEKSPMISKRQIQIAASEEIGGIFDVFCSRYNFSYLANTRLFCEARVGDIVCFAFLHAKSTDFI
ncbi:hypothetical protein FO519_003799 [Halicephalobus sp. NKZ332]|nr:hypothetical protein FO519_003799 [Halicephalobus sp. NKZ332]